MLQLLLLSPCSSFSFHIRSIKCLCCSPVSLQLIRSFMATFTAFPLQTRSSCSWDSFGSMENEISKTQAGCVRQTGTGDRTLMTWLRAQLAASCIRPVKWTQPIARDQVLTNMAMSCLIDRVWPWHSCASGTYWCFLTVNIVKLQSVG